MNPQHQLKTQGFTLIEVILALGILSLLAGSMIAITRSTLELTATVNSEQKKQVRVSLFNQHMKNCFAQVSRDSRYELEIDETTEQQTLTITNPNHFFPNQGADTLSQRSSLITHFNRDGILQINQTHISAAVKDLKKDTSPTHQVLLLDNLIQVEWEFYNQSSHEWLPYWQPSMGKPTQVRLRYQREFDEVATTLLFWLPKN